MSSSTNTPRPAVLLFDLDGTLVDSIDLILKSGRHAFIGFAGRAPSDDEWRASIGRPLPAMFAAHTNDPAEVARLIARYREFQLANHDTLLSAYDGAVEMIRAFARAGHPMALVTSKSDVLALRALELVGLAREIPVIVGMDSCERHKPHPEPVERALGLLGAEAADAIFVGDSPHDVHAGRAAGVFTVGVTWGAVAREEMERSGADVVIHEMTQLPDVVRRFSHPSAPFKPFEQSGYPIQ